MIYNPCWLPREDTGYQHQALLLLRSFSGWCHSVIYFLEGDPQACTVSLESGLFQAQALSSRQESSLSLSQSTLLLWFRIWCCKAGKVADFTTTFYCNTSAGLNPKIKTFK